jgi:hypothetical protein
VQALVELHDTESSGELSELAGGWAFPSDQPVPFHGSASAGESVPNAVEAT